MAATFPTTTPRKTTPHSLRHMNWLERWLHRAQSREGIAAHLVTGWRGELAAYFHLRRQGYTIVARDWRSHITPGDLDLVGWDGNRICFVEVKTRTERDWAPAESAVDEEKRRTLRKLARRYLRRACIPEAAARFDVVSVYIQEGQEPEVALLPNAFQWK